MDDDTTGVLVLARMLRSDTPLDPDTREIMANEMERLAIPNKARDRRKQQKLYNDILEHTIRDCRNRGMTVDEAKNAIVSGLLGRALGVPSVGALERRLRPSRK
jgi:hypothetical protein